MKSVTKNKLWIRTVAQVFFFVLIALIAINHALEANGVAIPQLSNWLDAPAEPLPGDSGMPRVQGPTFGASERFVVSPGREADGIFHMPGGQSGHFLSPYYMKGHDAWARGEATPFLPGESAHRLTLCQDCRNVGLLFEGQSSRNLALVVGDGYSRLANRSLLLGEARQSAWPIPCRSHLEGRLC